ncbi:helix-turn-helix domain-containing protein [Streptomyces sp. DSM 41699]|uniref:Helix-turn-helix domain-containing protein n=1 Tax=Streptomyces gibsoniae TaxID=3075529 RepID=A0ABU2U7C8_9ACTN|nr:helix-turn-helix domain-containing protein [Streptomyces sp. DSM 41699]MDT0468882.1 helix-turn-helix domain-containing protein [Streptomyces sp. DSM 41699]
MQYPDGGGLTAKQRAQREQVRFEAAESFAQGVTPTQVARRLQVPRKSAYAWHARWREVGVEALRSKGPSGRPSRMKPDWREWLAGEPSAPPVSRRAGHPAACLGRLQWSGRSARDQVAYRYARLPCLHAG